MFGWFIAPAAAETYLLGMFSCWFIGPVLAKESHDLADAFMLVIYLGVAAVLLSIDQWIILTHTGIVVRQVTKRRLIRWADLATGNALPPSVKATNMLRLALNNGEKPAEISFEGIHADPDFVARAIQHYAEHPEHRSAIGTQTELERLRSVLADGYVLAHADAD